MLDSGRSHRPVPTGAQVHHWCRGKPENPRQPALLNLVIQRTADMPSFQRIPEADWAPSRWLKHFPRNREGLLDPELLLACTGHTEEEIEIAWHEVREHLPQFSARFRWRRETYFILGFVLVHMAPKDRQAPFVLWTPELMSLRKRGLSRSGISRVQRYSSLATRAK